MNLWEWFIAWPNSAGKLCSCSSQQVKLGSVAPRDAPILPLSHMLQPQVTHLTHSRSCRGGEVMYERHQPDPVGTILSLVSASPPSPFRWSHFQYTHSTFPTHFFLSALLLLFFSFFLLFLAFCLTSGMKFYACLIRLVGVKRGPAFCQSMCWDTEAILKLPLMVVFNSPCISNSIEELCPCSIKGQSTHGEYSTEWFPKQLDSCTYPKLPQEMELLSTTRRRKKRML